MKIRHQPTNQHHKHYTHTSQMFEYKHVFQDGGFFFLHTIFTRSITLLNKTMMCIVGFVDSDPQDSVRTRTKAQGQL